MAGAAPLPMRRILFQDLSLPSQPRDRSRPLAEILGDEGIGPAPGSASSAGRRTPTGRASRRRRSSSTSCAGWSGPGGRVENASDLLIDPADGLRVINDVDQLAAFEWAVDARRRAGCAGCSRACGPGMTEREAVRLLDWNGTPLSCHLMLTAGPRATLGLLSPGDRRDRARRPVHDGVRDLGRPELPGRVRRRGRGRAAGRDRATTSSGSSGRISRPSRSGTRRSGSGCPAARSRRSSIATSATRSSGSS